MNEHTRQPEPMSTSAHLHQSDFAFAESCSPCTESCAQQCRGTLHALATQKEREISQLRSHMTQRIQEVTASHEAHKQIMIQQARHAAMGEMLGAIAHQWRQPLNVLALVVQNIKECHDYGTLTGEMITELVDKSMEQILYMSQTIDDFRNFFHPHQSSQQFNPQQCAQEAVYLLSGRFSSFADIAIAIESDSPSSALVHGCPSRFKQVVLNLLCNARDAITRRSKVSATPFSGTITVRIITSVPQKVSIEVADNGSGIAEDILDKVFEPFFSTKEQSSGSGIGLYLSRLIIEHSMSGTLNAANTDSGALFRITLPVIAQ